MTPDLQGESLFSAMPRSGGKEHNMGSMGLNGSYDSLVIHPFPLGLLPFLHCFNGEMGKVGVGIITSSNDLQDTNHVSPFLSHMDGPMQTRLARETVVVRLGYTLLISVHVS